MCEGGDDGGGMCEGGDDGGVMCEGGKVMCG